MKNSAGIIRRAASFVKRHRVELLVSAAIFLLAMSLVTPSYDWRLRREVRRVQREVQKRQKQIEKFAFMAIDSKDEECFEIKNLSEDMVIYKYVGDSLKSWTNRFPISNDDISSPNFSYRLKYLNSNDIYTPPLAFLNYSEQYVNLGSSWYIMSTQFSADRRIKVVTGVLIKTEYATGNILGSVNKRLKLSDGFTTTSITNDVGGVVYGIEGYPLFSVVPSDNTPIINDFGLLRWVSLLLLLVALFLYHGKMHNGRSLIIAISGIVVARVAAMIFSSGHYPGSLLFSPMLYADTRLLNSLGTLLFNNITLSLLIYAIFMARYALLRKVERRGEYLKRIVTITSVVVSVMLVAYIHWAIKSLVINSNIELEPFRLEEMSIYSILCFFSLAMLFLALLFLLQMIVVFTRGKRRFTMLSWRNITTYALVVALYCVLAISAYGLEKETLSNRVRTAKLAMERDLSLELHLRSVDRSIASDPFISVLTPLRGMELIKNRLMERYFYKDIIQKYNIKLTCCAPDNMLNLGIGTPPVGCYSFYQDLLDDYGIPLDASSDFFYLNNYNGRASYLGVFTYVDDSYQVSRLFIEIEGKYSNDPLDIQSFGANKDNGLPKYASFARYSDSRLVSHGGRYVYPVELTEDFEEGYFTYSKDGYLHFVNKLSDEEVTMISRPRRPFFPYLVSFSYFALFFGIFMVFFTKWGRTSKLFSLPKHSLKRKITLLTTATMVVALVSVGVVEILFGLRVQNHNNLRVLESSVNTIQSALAPYCKYAMRYSDAMTPGLFSAMDEISSITNTDINLYDIHGSLVRSTHPEIFEQYIVGKRMNHNAYHAMIHEKALRFVDVEKLVDVKYYSVYAPILNNDGQIVAIVNVPYVSENNNFSDPVSTVATVVNIYLVLLLAALLLGIFLSNSMMRPIAEIKNRLDRLTMTGSGNKHITYKNSRDELGVLVASYNKMVDDLEESTRRLAQNEREQAWKEMARQVAHDIKNSMTPVRLSLQYLIRLKANNVAGWEDKFDAISQSLIDQIDVLAGTADEFSAIARSFGEDLSDVDLLSLLSEQIVLFDNKENISFNYGSEVAEPVVVTHRKQLARVFVNLLTNAVQAIEGCGRPGRIEVSIHPENSGDSQWYRIDFEDDGPGVNDENLGKLFVPNFTTKTSGTGLGLAMCKSVVEQSGGTISYSRSESMGGACFTMRLPAKAVTSA